MAENKSLKEWSDGEGHWIFDINGNKAPGEEDRIRDAYSSLGEWSDPEGDDIVRNVFVDSEWSNHQVDATIIDDNEQRDPEPTGMNTDDSERCDPADINIDSEQRDPEPAGMNGDDSERSDPVGVNIQIERGKKRKRNQVQLPEKEPWGNGKSKRISLDSRENLKKNSAVITINTDDDLCLARALVVAIARIQKHPKYDQIRKSDRYIQEERALQLHRAANVPLGTCGMDEVKQFQKYLTDYEITILSGNHGEKIIYPPVLGYKQPIHLYYQNGHFDVITRVSSFLSQQKKNLQ